MDSTHNNQQNQQPAEQKPTIGDKLQNVGDSVKATFEHHKAAPGPAISQDIGNVPEEGTKEERRAKAEQWNK